VSFSVSWRCLVVFVSIWWLSVVWIMALGCFLVFFRCCVVAFSGVVAFNVLAWACGLLWGCGFCLRT